MSYLEVDSLNKSLGKVEILKNLSLSAETGQIIGLKGDNGAGKSTFIKILASVYKADSGRLSLGGVSNPQSKAWREQVAWVPQDIALDEALTVRDNLKFWAALSFLGRAERKKALNKAYTDPLIADFIDKKVSELSGGMKRRANLLSSIFISRKLVLLDEPFAGADAESCQLMEERIQDLAKEGALLILISHEAQALYRLSDRLILLKDGKLREMDLLKAEDSRVILTK